MKKSLLLSVSDPDSTLKVHKKYPFVNFTIDKLCFKKLQV